MIVGEFDALGPGVGPNETKAEPVVYPDRVLSNPIVRQGVKLVARRCTQVVESSCRIKQPKLPTGRLEQVSGKALGASPVEHCLGGPVVEASDRYASFLSEKNVSEICTGSSVVLEICTMSRMSVTDAWTSPTPLTIPPSAVSACDATGRSGAQSPAPQPGVLGIQVDGRRGFPSPPRAGRRGTPSASTIRSSFRPMKTVEEIS